MIRIIYIYALTEPCSFEIRYIGKTHDPTKRKLQHINEAKNNTSDTYKLVWLRDLLKTGSRVEMSILEMCLDDWPEREQYWIKHYREQGHRLTNWADGGQGGSGKCTEQTKIKKRRPILQCSKGGEVIKHWGSGKEAGEILGIEASNISKCIQGKRSLAGGYLWKAK